MFADKSHRLMEHYDLRSCFLPDLSGLHLRIYQFQQLLSRHLPRLTAHLEDLQIQPLYVSQWFLSFFAVTCPLPMLLRIYDIILTEGASETLMRVALSLMRRNKDKIMECTEIEGRSLDIRSGVISQPSEYALLLRLKRLIPFRAKFGQFKDTSMTSGG